ncbi:MAG: helix-turn-helix domain-containing protein [Clostridia bacterium]|nr:helix-turn-helix domain-containing protein [Clostridia bacterium]
MKIQFSTNLKSLRENAEMRQADLAQLLNTTQRKISYWESGKVEPDLESLWKIADIFHVTIDELIGKSE